MQERQSSLNTEEFVTQHVKSLLAIHSVCAHSLCRKTTPQALETKYLQDLQKTQIKFSLPFQTPLDDVPVAMAPFQGRLLVGVGHLLRIYDIGKKKMLRKCENKHIPHLVVDIQTVGSRIFVSDVQEAVHFVKYKAADNQLVIFADEVYQR